MRLKRGRTELYSCPNVPSVISNDCPELLFWMFPGIVLLFVLDHWYERFLKLLSQTVSGIKLVWPAIGALKFQARACNTLAFRAVARSATH